MYYVYLLLLNNQDLYKGTTSNLKQRIKDHNLGKVESTKNFLPAELIYYEAYPTKKEAVLREKFLKTNEGRKSLKKQLSITLKS